MAFRRCRGPEIHSSLESWKGDTVRRAGGGDGRVVRKDRIIPRTKNIARQPDCKRRLLRVERRLASPTSVKSGEQDRPTVAVVEVADTVVV